MFRTQRRRFIALISMAVTSLILVIGLQFVNLSPGAAQSTTTLNVYAAISLTNAFNEIKSQYQLSNPNVNIVYTYGASGTLLNQIESGAPADIFVSAAVDQINTLQNEGKLVSGSRKNIARNRLVLIVPTTAPVNAGSAALTSFNGLTNSNIRGIAIGDSAIVPAGKYATQVFNFRGISNQVQSKLVLASNVRNALTGVENKSLSGRTIDAGVVYTTDANISNKVRVVETAAQQEHDAIVYPLGILTRSTVKSTAQAFSTYLSGTTAQNILIKYKFGKP
ncbi:molybdate ABC transporter substrate-binding protein [Nostoc sp. UHCC 0302]|uniref:molybdate ABC transporter substrate-binding protein n=1 Tax=Nostoc sp. UHCC 0302 TaxID=3134896 RepID=UPI00311CBA29